MEVNMIAAAEIARQLRLRDMGGIIVIDFIDLSILKIVKYCSTLREEMNDERNTRSYPSKFGLVQITRQRVRPEVNIKTREEDPNDVNGGSANFNH
jgi:ribonuclease G